jgi:hypothetical protein
MKKILYIILFILLGFYFYQIICNEHFENTTIKYYDYGNINSKKLCIVAGVHGNEPAATILLNNMIKNKYFNNTNFFIRIIPVANEYGIKNNTRYQNNILYPDINRNFIENGLDSSSKQLIELTKDMNLILDFHEGWGFHKINPTSIGSTVTVSKNMKELGNIIINNLNKIIKKEAYKFILLDDICDIDSTLGCYSNNNNMNYILVETTGQNDIQPLEIRHTQIKNVIDTVLNHMSQ